MSSLVSPVQTAARFSRRAAKLYGGARSKMPKSVQWLKNDCLLGSPQDYIEVVDFALLRISLCLLCLRP
jgi:hypothetical protein